MTGQIAGMAGAFGNVGAVVYLVIYSLVDSSTFFYILAGGAAFSFLYCLVFLKEPKGAFDEDYSDTGIHVSPAKISETSDKIGRPAILPQTPEFEG